MRRAFCILFFMIFTLLIVGCSNNATEKDNEKDNNQQQDNKNDQIENSQGTVSYTDVQKSIIDGLKEHTVGDYISFGQYEQDGDDSNGTEKIEWKILDKNDDGILLISRYGLDAIPYDEMHKDSIWSICTLRIWLNRNFFESAFSKDEQSLIKTVANTNDYCNDDLTGYQQYSFGDDTRDRVFILDVVEASRYFSSDSERICEATPYAILRCAETNDDNQCYWWLRTGTNPHGRSSSIESDGIINLKGISIGWEGACVRPAVWVSLGDGRSTVNRLTPTPVPKSDTVEYLSKIQTAEIGDNIILGHFEQTDDIYVFDDNGFYIGAEEPIEWTVIAKEDNKLLVISKYGLLDGFDYNTDGLTELKWEKSYLREWLNGEFFYRSFDNAERKLICTTKVPAERNPDYNFDPGEDTEDKVFLLSISEVEKYLPDPESRKVYTTDFVSDQYGYISRSDEKYFSWFLRTPGNGTTTFTPRDSFLEYEFCYLSSVDWDGNINTAGNLFRFSAGIIEARNMFESITVIRPAMWIEIP